MFDRCEVDLEYDVHASLKDVYDSTIEGGNCQYDWIYTQRSDNFGIWLNETIEKFNETGHHVNFNVEQYSKTRHQDENGNWGSYTHKTMTNDGFHLILNGSKEHVEEAIKYVAEQGKGLPQRIDNSFKWFQFQKARGYKVANDTVDALSQRFEESQTKKTIFEERKEGIYKFRDTESTQTVTNGRYEIDCTWTSV